MTAPEVTPEMVEAATLAFANRIRAKHGLEPLDRFRRDLVGADGMLEDMRHALSAAALAANPADASTGATPCQCCHDYTEFGMVVTCPFAAILAPALEGPVRMVWMVEYSKKGPLGFFTEWIDFGDDEAGARRLAARELDGKLLCRPAYNWAEVTDDGGL